MAQIVDVPAVRPDPTLTRVATEFGVGGDYIADIIAPPAMVENDLFKYAAWGREEIESLTHMAERAPGTGASTIELSVTYTAGAVRYWGLKHKLPDEIKNNHPNPADLEMRRTKVLTGKLRLGIEQRIFDLIDAGTKTSAAPTVKWDAASATIRADILADIDTFRKNAGYLPTHLILPPAVARIVFNDTNILDLLKHTQGGKLADSRIPIIENMTVLVPGTVVNSANPGAAASIGDIYSKDEAYYLYVDTSAGNDLAAATAMRQVRSMALAAASFATFRWRDPDASAQSDWIAVVNAQTEVTVAQEFMLSRLDVLT